MQKNVEMNFWWESFHYLAQRTQRARRQSIISHRGHRGRGGIQLSRTEDAEGAEAVVTSYFRLHASYFVQRHSMQGAGTRSVESPWLTHDGFSLARTADAEGAEVTPPCDSPTYRILHGSPVETVPSGQVVLIHCVL